MAGRIISYIIELISVIGIWLLYLIKKNSSNDNIVGIILTFVYAIFIHDLINTGFQSLLIWLMGSAGKPDGFAKIVKEFVWKEVYDIFKNPTSQITPLNSEITPKSTAPVNTQNAQNDASNFVMDYEIKDLSATKSAKNT